MTFDISLQPKNRPINSFVRWEVHAPGADVTAIATITDTQTIIKPTGRRGDYYFWRHQFTTSGDHSISIILYRLDPTENIIRDFVVLLTNVFYIMDSTQKHNGEDDDGEDDDGEDDDGEDDDGEDDDGEDDDGEDDDGEERGRG